MRVLFWGTATFALPSLRSVADADHEIVGVVTQPDRRAGRGRRPRPTPVKEAALAAEYPVFTPERPGRPAFLARMRGLRPDLSVVAAYGHFLSREALDLPALGSINVHASLLPRWRGAAPVERAILAGDERTGVSIMLMDEGLDTGDILVRSELAIGATECAGELRGRLAALGDRRWCAFAHEQRQQTL